MSQAVIGRGYRPELPVLFGCTSQENAWNREGSWLYAEAVHVDTTVTD